MAEAQWEEAYVTDDLAEDLVRIIRRLSYPLAPLPTDVASRCGRATTAGAVLFDVYGTLFVSKSGDYGNRRDTPKDPSDQSPPIISSLEASGCEILDPDAAEVGESEYDATIRAIHEDKRNLGIQHPEVDIVKVWTQVLEELNGSGLIRVPDDAALAYRVAVHYECRTNPVWPMPGAFDTVERIAHADLALGIVSNAQFMTPLLFPALFDRTTAELNFDDRLCSYSFQIGEAKPSVRLFENVRDTLFRQMGVAPEQILYVGNDMLNDVWAAQQAGLSTCLFAGDQRSLRMRRDDPLCARVEPDHVVTQLSELCQVLGIPRSKESQ